jgi:hypothetical protein
LSLLCGIDPRESELFDAAYYYKVPNDEIGLFAAETRTDIESLEYWKIQLLADPPHTAKRTWYANADD